MTQEPLWQPSDISPDAGGEGESPKRRGRIPQSAWPRILELYKGGTTLSAIAREFECTPSAISYIIRKAEAGEGAGGEDAAQPAAVPAAQPMAPPATRAAAEQVRDDGGDSPAQQPRADVRPSAEPRVDRQELPFRDARNDRQSGDQRRTAPPGGAAGGHGPGGRAPQHQQPRQNDFRHSDGRHGEARHGEARHGESRHGEPRSGEGRHGEGRQRHTDQRPFEQRPFEQRHAGADPRGGGEQRGGEQRGFAHRPPREDRFAEERGVQESGFADVGRFDRPSGPAAYPYRQHRNAARQEALEAPSEPADQRMDAAAKTCAELYRTWKANGGQGGMQALADALHEMRKVIARMEIEMSASRREEQRPIPIPGYRMNQPPPQQPRG